jgi:hypothetical protein
MPDKKKLSDIADERKVSQDHISYVIDRARVSNTCACPTWLSSLERNSFYTASLEVAAK